MPGENPPVGPVCACAGGAGKRITLTGLPNTIMASERHAKRSSTKIITDESYLQTMLETQLTRGGSPDNGEKTNEPLML